MISGISGNSFLWQKYQNVKQYPQDDHKSKDLDYQTDIDKHQSNVENFIFHDHVDQSKYAKKLSYVNENVILFFAQILIGFWLYKQAKKKCAWKFKSDIIWKVVSR